MYGARLVKTSILFANIAADMRALKAYAASRPEPTFSELSDSDSSPCLCGTCDNFVGKISQD